MHEFDRHVAFESAVVAAREPHCTHAAAAERPFQFVGADSLSRERWQRVVDERRFVEKRRGEHPIVFEQEALDRVGDVGLFGAQAVEQGLCGRPSRDRAPGRPAGSPSATAACPNDA